MKNRRLSLPLTEASQAAQRFHSQGEGENCCTGSPPQDRSPQVSEAQRTGCCCARAPARCLRSSATTTANKYEPFALGLLIKPFPDPEKKIALVRQLGIPTCFLSLDDYIGKFTPALVTTMRDALDKHQIVATTVEVVRPLPLKWNFVEGPSTIGVVPRAYRAARIDALKQVSDFAKQLGIDQIQTHCGFIPENPKDGLYEETVQAIRELTLHCAGNGQSFLMETGQETPTTMLRVIRDVNHPALGVGLDTANLILYGKANPVDAVKILGPYVRAMHAKDGDVAHGSARAGQRGRHRQGRSRLRQGLQRPSCSGL